MSADREVFWVSMGGAHAGPRALSLLLAASVYIQEYQDEHMNGEMNISSSTDADLQVNKYKKT